MSAGPATGDEAPRHRRGSDDVTADRSGAGSGDTLETMAIAGAVLQAFAAGTLRVDVPPSAPRPHLPPSEQTVTVPDLPEVSDAVPAPRAAPEADEPVAREPVAAAEPEQPLPTEIVFRPVTRTRSVLGVLLLLGVVATAWTVVEAVRDPDGGGIGVAAALAVVTGLVGAARARRGVAHLRLAGSRLEVHRAGTRLVFDLADPRLAVEVVGRPGDRGWRVVLPRRGMTPVVIDARMVDPDEFTTALGVVRTARPVTQAP